MRGRMRSIAGVRPLLLAVLAALVLGAVPWPVAGATAPSPASALPAWTGGVDLYREGTFSTQRTWSWCTAAGLQMIRNIQRGEADHSRAAQQRYYRYMREHNAYPVPPEDGVDPGGWEAGLRRFVDDRYRVVASPSFDAALRSAVTSLRRTNLPVAIAVSRGNHAWTLTGFTATADPLVTDDFRVTSVRVSGSLWGLQSRKWGYDMAPNRKLSPKQLATFFTAWHYPKIEMAWEGRWVSLQAVVPEPAPTTGAGSAAGTRRTLVAAIDRVPDPAPAAVGERVAPGLTAGANPPLPQRQEPVRAVPEPTPSAGPAMPAARSVAPGVPWVVLVALGFAGLMAGAAGIVRAVHRRGRPR